MNATRFLPPAVSAADVTFANGVFGGRRRLALKLGGAELRARLLPPRGAGVGQCVRWTDGVRHAWVRLADWDSLPPVADLCGGAFAALPAEVQAVVLEVALAPLLDALGNAVGSAWKIDAAEWPAEPAHAAAFELCGPAGTARTGELALDAAAAADLPKVLQEAPPLPWRNLDHTPLPVRLLLGETRIPRAELAALRPHDVVVIERLFGPANAGLPGGCRAAIGDRIAFDATLAEGQATLAGPAAFPADAAEPLVRFEIPAAPLTLGAARTLQPGAALAFDAGDDVALTLSGVRLAAGTLVRCGAFAGVRLR